MLENVVVGVQLKDLPRVNRTEFMNMCTRVLHLARVGHVCLLTGVMEELEESRGDNSRRGSVLGVVRVDVSVEVGIGHVVFDFEELAVEISGRYNSRTSVHEPRGCCKKLFS